MAVESFTEKALRARRAKGGPGWTLDDERRWLESHPDDTPLDGYEHATLPTPEEVTHDDDLVPDIDAPERSQEEQDIDAVLERIGIVEAYNKWSNKGTVEPGNKTEGIKVRCPNPAHPDHDPSAWLNTNKQVWVCAGCGFEGGDKFDIAAWSLGFPVPGYKQGKGFHELRRAMAIDLGYTVRGSGSGSDRVVAPAASTSDAPRGESASPAPDDESQDEPSATVTTLHPEPTPADFISKGDAKKIKIDWTEYADDSSFLAAWMDATSKDDLPEEYYFWQGLMAIGLAAGRDVRLLDLKDVFGNLFLTIIGTTGSGKTRTTGNLKRMLYDALPYDHDDPSNMGVRMVEGSSSGEALIDQFVKEEDPLDPTNKNTVSVRGLIDFGELATLIGKASSPTSILKPKLMDFYDNSPVVSTSSRSFGNAMAREPFAAAVTSTQPRSIRNLVNHSDIDSGFLNRWVFIYGTEKERVAYGNTPLDLHKPAEALRSLKGWCARMRGLPGMTLTGEALDLYVKFHARVVTPIISSTAGFDDDPMLGRIELTMKKLILLFTIDSKEPTPSKRSVEKAISLWPYLEMTYTLASGAIASTPDNDLENEIISLIETYDKQGSKAQRKTVSDRLARKHERESIKRAIERLMFLQILEEEESRTGTRGPSKKYLILKEE